MAFAALVPLYREVIFLLVSFVFALSTIAVTGMYDIHARYHYLLHKGIWEDIMISGIDPYGSSDAASKNTPIEKDPSGRRLPPGVFTVLSEVRGALGDLDCQLAVYQAKEVMLNVISVSLEDRDISNIHGQMDVWIKAYATSDDLPPEVRDIPKGAVVISSSLAGKFSKEVAKYSDRIYMELGAWGKNLMKSFQLHGVLELGGGINVIYMNPDDLQELGFQYAPYVIGIERNFSPKGPIREALLSAPSLQSLRITRPEDRQRPSPLLFFIQLAPLFLMSLFFFILLILYHYTVLSSYEKRVTELGLMRLYAYPKWKRLVMFFFLNVSPAPFGFFYGARWNGLQLAVFL